MARDRGIGIAAPLVRDEAPKRRAAPGDLPVAPAHGPPERPHRGHDRAGRVECLQHRCEDVASGGSAAVGADAMGRGQALCGRHPGQQALAGRALDGLREQDAAPVEREQTGHRPPAEAAVGVIQDREWGAGGQTDESSCHSPDGHTLRLVTTRLVIEYDGTDFAGWAAQPGLRTVQGELERALAVIARVPVALTVAGRTDRGVHAWGQVASYPGDPVRLSGVNAVLPADVAVLACESAADGFDARRDAMSRTYCYRLLRRRARSVFERRTALHWPHPIDREALNSCAGALLGTHDFTAFTPTETDHVRFERNVFAAEWREAGEILEFWIEADTFLRHMNRALVGTMLEIAGGRRTPAEFAALLEGRPREQAGPTAAACGLALARVSYESCG
jgi:tRNA pseudouridine38-40 synthase